ncbi:hypothetical protein KIN20_001770 [Parelaphostrongylus tenuis]|uniref:Uncharacterized protein n=1 Tax=Parelaphostrongylus tenuis TaxID=148309 RepID=A0AAD5QEV6_PARTN|nr:hypothetical protein KIN20_001770 [Parelaphostrongylus tenuis]
MIIGHCRDQQTGAQGLTVHLTLLDPLLSRFWLTDHALKGASFKVHNYTADVVQHASNMNEF